MIFNAISLILAFAPATLFAAPTPTAPGDYVNNIIKRHMTPDDVRTLSDGACDLSAVTVPAAPKPLPAPEGLTLAHVALGRGTQNYTCTSNSAQETPTAVGAVAHLYNITCQAARAPAILANITRLALDYAVPTSGAALELLSGHHEFNSSGKPFFSLKTDAHDYGSVNVKKVNGTDAPSSAVKGKNEMGSVTWLYLESVDGAASEYKAVYRVNTAGGMNWPTCEGRQGTYEVEYAAEYWFYK